MTTPGNSQRARPDRIADSDLLVVSRGRVRSRVRIHTLLEEAEREKVGLFAGVSSSGAKRSARILESGPDHLVLQVDGIPFGAGPELTLGFDMFGVSYSFRSKVEEWTSFDVVRIACPVQIYETERRRASRARVNDEQAQVQTRPGEWLEVPVVDVAAEGLGIEVPLEVAASINGVVQLRRQREGTVACQLSASVRHKMRVLSRSGRVRIGLAVTPTSATDGRRLVEIVKDFGEITFDEVTCSGKAGAGLELQSEVIDYRNSCGERIRAILDSVGDCPGAPVVIVPPAWGRTKETLLPLARTIVETFQAAGDAIRVIRFDGVRRRGESHGDAECLDVGSEHLHFSVSQAVDDIVSTIKFVDESERIRAGSIALVSSSVSAVEARRALLSDRGDRIATWISLVGITDLQNALRTFSGGIDFGMGWIDGVRFGRQEILGVLCDMDRLAADAIENGAWFSSDAATDFQRIRVPISWIHGEYDAWTSTESVRRMLSQGFVSNRRLLRVPTGHQLRSGSSARHVFGLVAQELAGNLLGREVQPKVPDAGELAAIARRERRRLPTPGIDLRRFWADYLVGRRGELGIELLAETDDYRDLMGAQIKALSMRPGDVVLDLGSGVGEFPLRSFDEVGSSVRILMIDHVLAGLRRAQSRISERDGLLRSRVDALVADLDGVTACKPIPLAENSVDAVLGSLVLGYLRNPVEVLRDVRRILRAGGRIVVSSMVKDADISRVYVRHLDASQSELLTVRKGELGRLRQIRQDFLNDAAKIIDLEEFGVFKFFGAGELESMLRAAGFHDLRTSYAFGNPAQAVIVSARL